MVKPVLQTLCLSVALVTMIPAGIIDTKCTANSQRVNISPITICLQGFCVHMVFVSICCFWDICSKKMRVFTMLLKLQVRSCVPLRLSVVLFITVIPAAKGLHFNSCEENSASMHDLSGTHACFLWLWIIYLGFIFLSAWLRVIFIHLCCTQWT